MKAKQRLTLGLFGKFYLTMALSGVLLIWLVIVVSEYTEKKLSTVSMAHQTTLQNYADQASDILNDKLSQAQQQQQLQVWAAELKARENTWFAIMKAEPEWLLGEYNNQVFEGYTDLSIGRDIAYPIHLYFSQNPVMKISIKGSGYNLLIQLPQRMRPGAYWQVLNTLIKLGLPILLVALLCILLYGYIIAPLRVLQLATHGMSQGDYNVRLDAKLAQRQDELGELAASFNTMAQRISTLISRQRQLIQDISHELRTPITRIKLVLAGKDKHTAMARVEQEINGMQTLLEDTLTLSWLNNEEAQLVQEALDLTLLIETIAEDACFEFSRECLLLTIPESCVIKNSNHRAVGQALENIIRNAMKYTEPDIQVQVLIKLLADNQQVEISICDEGNGIATEFLEEIFEPFFRINSARDSGGYGLGLALSKRQVEAVGGSLYACHNLPKGLCFVMTLPLK